MTPETKARRERVRAEKKRQRAIDKIAAAEAHAESRRYHSVGNRKAKPKRQQVFASEPDHMLTKRSTTVRASSLPSGLKSGMANLRLPGFLYSTVEAILTSTKPVGEKRAAIEKLLEQHGYSLLELRGHRGKVPVHTLVKVSVPDDEDEFTVVETLSRKGQHKTVERDQGQHRLYDDFLPGSREKRFIKAPKN